MKLYLSGPMSGYEGFNYAAFAAAAAMLRARGHEVFNPAETFDGDTTRERHEYMRLDIAGVLDAEAVVVLPGWRASRGALLEVAVARECGLAVLDFPGLEPSTETALQEAQRLVYGDRGASYGHPLDDYERTSTMATALIAHKLAPGERITAEDFIRFMVCVKLSRDVHAPKRDNRVDMAGYAECLQRVTEERLRREADGAP